MANSPLVVVTGGAGFYGSVLIRLIDEVGDEHWESIATHLLSEKLSEKRALSALTAVRSSMLPHLRWLALNSLSR